MPHYRAPGWFTTHVLNTLVAGPARLGISISGSRLLRVKGRKSGEWRSTPVNVLVHACDRYLVSPRGETQWVRNIRAAGGGELVLGRNVERFRAVAVGDDEKPPILRAYLQRWWAESGTFFGSVKTTSSEEDLRRIAPEHPVFRVDPS